MISGELGPNNSNGRDKRTREAAKLRDIAKYFHDQIEALNNDDSDSQAKKILFRRRRDQALYQAEQIDPAFDLTPEDIERIRSEPLYKIVGTEPLTFELDESRPMSDEEISDWVDSQIIADPSIPVRLGFTDEMSIIDTAIKIIFDRQNQTTE